jgi:hypothetical protein
LAWGLELSAPSAKPIAWCWSDLTMVIAEAHRAESWSARRMPNHSRPSGDVGDPGAGVVSHTPRDNSWAKAVLPPGQTVAAHHSPATATGHQYLWGCGAPRPSSLRRLFFGRAHGPLGWLDPGGKCRFPPTCELARLVAMSGPIGVSKRPGCCAHPDPLLSGAQDGSRTPMALQRVPFIDFHPTVGGARSTRRQPAPV